MSTRSRISKSAPAAKNDRSRILSGARQRFLAHGFRNVTMAELASELGMSKKTLYVYFPSKEVLLAEMIEWKLHHLRTDLKSISEFPDLSFADRLERLLAGLNEHMAEVQPAFVHDMQKADPDLFKRIQQERRKLIHGCFGKLLSEGRNEGAVRNDIPVKMLIEMLLGAVDAILFPARMNELGITPRTAFGQIVGVFLEGALVRTKSSK